MENTYEAKMTETQPHLLHTDFGELSRAERPLHPGVQQNRTTSPVVRDQARRKEQFIGFMRWVQITALLTTLLGIFIGLATNVAQLYILALASSLLFIEATAAQRMARADRLNRGVYLFVVTMFMCIEPLPLFISDLLPAVLIGNIVAVVLVGLFVSSRRILRMAAIGAVVSLLPLAFELWPPFSPADLPALSLLLTLIAPALSVYLIYLFGDNLNRALGASQSYADELERSQTELLARSRELELTTTDLLAQRTELEQTNRQLAQVVHQNQRRAAMLQATAQVNRAIVRIHDLDQLLPRITQLISQHFDVYHAGIFLIDETHRYAALRAANSPGGQHMLARQHRLAVGSEGLVGYTTGTGRPRIALDVGADAVYFDNPDLPDTRSEVALPLRVGDEIIGALDVQSTKEAAFDNEDMTVLTVLADQIAIAIQNARRFQQTQAALAEAENAYRRFLRQEWDSFLGARTQQAPATSSRTISPQVKRT